MLSTFVLELVVVLAAFLDLRNRRIPNWLTGSAALAGLALNTYQSGWPGLKQSLLGLLAAFAVYTLLFALRAMGGGDVKLMAAVGAFTGPEAWFMIFLITALVGGLVAIGTLLLRGGFRETLGNLASIFSSLAHFRAPHKDKPELDVSNPLARTLPHGVSIAAGVLIYFVWIAA